MTRDDNGRFRTGNPGGPGRPARAVEAQYLVALREECPLETWREIVRRAVAGAVEGDFRARQWLGRFLLPEPATGIEEPEPEDGDDVFTKVAETLGLEQLKTLNAFFKAVKDARTPKPAQLPGPDANGDAGPR